MQKDKILHLTLSTALIIIIYASSRLVYPHLSHGLTTSLPPPRRACLLLSLSLSLSLGALKELLDSFQIGTVRPCPCNAEWADLAADAAGCLAGAAAVEVWERFRYVIDSVFG